MRLVGLQVRMELVTLLRNYEQLLLVFVIPIGALVFLGSVDVLGEDVTLSRVVASVLALSVMSAAMVSTGIATGFERSYRVLKRLGVTPLGRHRLVWAKAGAVGVVEVAQSLVVVLIAVAMGWSTANVVVWQVVAAVVLATAAFAGIGLLLAGRLRAETNLAAQNGLYLLLLAVGGVVVPIEDLPTILSRTATFLPSGAFTELLASSLETSSTTTSTTTSDVRSWLVLFIWAIVAPIGAARFFRFDD